MLPQKRLRPRSGIARAPKRDWPKHRAFIRRHACVVSMGIVHDDCDGPIECAHYRTAENAGMSIKPHDAHTFSACQKHHAEQHRIGQPAFERKYGLKIEDICREFARLSTDAAMKEAMKLSESEAA